MGHHDEDHEGIKTPTHEEGTFVLEYAGLVIGYLTLQAGKWTFQYTPAFIAQTDVQPLVDFPDPNKTYRSSELWPFFMARIPSVAQPEVLQTIKAEGLDEHSAVQLLRRFGRTTISNPFVLVESA